ncbi:MAG: hypothetical protein HYU29_05945 [Chloroflexi bacterium]|nr:hypothetical protein [Chloroflexota bacterium]
MAKGMFEVSYAPGGEIILRFRPKELRVLPEDTKDHMKAASREFLLAFRTFLDACVTRVEQAEGTTRARRRTRVPVQEEK